MDLSSGGISEVIFKTAVGQELGNFSLDSNMLSVLMTLDGRRSVGEVAVQSGLKMSTMRDVLSKLLQLKLIEAIEKKTPVLDDDFLTHLEDQFSLAIGPIAGIIIEDEMKALGYSQSAFPGNRAAELIDILAREIQRDEKKSEFKQTMVKKIMEKGL